MEKTEQPEAAAAKKTKVKKPKYEDLPEIPDYDRPELEKYEESDFNPSKNEKLGISFPKKSAGKESFEEPVQPISALKARQEAAKAAAEEEKAKKSKAGPKSKYEELPKIDDYERPELEKYDPNDFDPTKNVKAEKSLPQKEIAGKEPEVKARVDPKTKKEVAKEIVEESVPAAKKKAAPKTKYEELPVIEDYERPALEKYEASDFDPTKNVKAEQVLEPAKPKEEVKIEQPKVKKNIPPKKIEDQKFVPGQAFALKPLNKKPKAEPAPEESAETTISAPKKPITKTSTEDSADAKIKTKSQKPPSVVEEKAVKNIVIRGKEGLQPIEEDPIEIRISDADDEQMQTEDKTLKKSVSFDEEMSPEGVYKKKVRRTKYDPLAYIPDDDDFETPKQENIHDPISESQPYKKYDPMKYVPDKDDLPSVENLDGSNITEVITNTLHIRNTNSHKISILKRR